MPTRWLITGASGQLGGHLVASLSRRPDVALLAMAGQHEVPATRPGDTIVNRTSLTDPKRLAIAVRIYKPKYIIHTAALTAVSACYQDPDLASACNVAATEVIADVAAKIGARMVFTSTDMVFRGDNAPYDESAAPDAESVYGQSKIAAEHVLADRPATVIVRIPLLYGMPTTPRASTFRNQIASLRAGQPLRMFADEWRTPVSLRAAASVLLALAESDETGLWHLAGPRRMSRLDLILAAAEVLGLDTARVESISRLSIDSPEPRPGDLSLDGSRLAQRFPELRPAPLEEADLQA